MRIAAWSQHPAALRTYAGARARIDVPVHAVGTQARRGTGYSHAKAILFGEHAVVYGAPAIATPMPGLGLEAIVTPATGRPRLTSSLYTGPIDAAPDELAPTITALASAFASLGAPNTAADLEIRSTIPPSRGLGSSAATGAAVLDAVADFLDVRLDAQRRHRLIQANSERVAHGSPSGIDAHSVVADGPIWFHHGAVETLDVGAAYTFVLADTGVPSGTRAAVAGVRKRMTSHPHSTRAAVDAIADLTREARTDLAEGSRQAIGEKMSHTHDLLVELGVSSPALDTLVAAATQAGALGAKLTGGGRGGCMIALVEGPAQAAPVAAALHTAGASGVWTTTVGDSR